MRVPAVLAVLVALVRPGMASEPGWPERTPRIPKPKPGAPAETEVRHPGPI